MKPNYETCQHAVSVGSVAVYVTPGCPNYHKLSQNQRSAGDYETMLSGV